MSIQDNTIVGLRAQILENWRYVEPYAIKPIIIIARNNSFYEAVLTEESTSGKILKVSARRVGIEDALRDLLDKTCETVNDQLRRRRDCSGRFIL
ncbi:hypothetical protein KCU93_g5974, partial [Aureobasidium melanogenum]